MAALATGCTAATAGSPSPNPVLRGLANIPSLVLDLPPDDSAVTDAQFMFEGTGPPGFELTVRNLTSGARTFDWVSIGADGRWSFLVTLAEGVNVYSFSYHLTFGESAPQHQIAAFAEVTYAPPSAQDPKPAWDEAVCTAADYWEDAYENYFDVIEFLGAGDLWSAEDRRQSSADHVGEAKSALDGAPEWEPGASFVAKFDGLLGALQFELDSLDGFGPGNYTPPQALYDSWRAVLEDVSFKVEADCSLSQVYH